MPRRRCLVLPFLAAVMFAAGPARADSPLTSTDLATSYSDLPAVAEARQTHQCNGAVLEFLLSGAPNDQKAAVVNALGWQDAQNAELFLQGFAHAHNLDPERLEPKNLSASDRFVAGYLMALEGYLDLKPLRPNGKGVWGKKPLELLDGAAKELPDDFAVQYVRALVKAQEVMDKSWCQVFKLPKGVLDRFPAGKRNLRPGAVESVQGYLSLYEKECPGSKAADKEKLEQLNQNFTLVQLGGQIVAGTQGGVVVWDPAQPTKPVATRQGRPALGPLRRESVRVRAAGRSLQAGGPALARLAVRRARAQERRGVVDRLPQVARHHFQALCAQERGLPGKGSAPAGRGRDRHAVGRGL